MTLFSLSPPEVPCRYRHPFRWKSEMQKHTHARTHTHTHSFSHTSAHFGGKAKCTHIHTYTHKHQEDRDRQTCTQEFIQTELEGEKDRSENHTCTHTLHTRGLYQSRCHNQYLTPRTPRLSMNEYNINATTRVTPTRHALHETILFIVVSCRMCNMCTEFYAAVSSWNLCSGSLACIGGGHAEVPDKGEKKPANPER